MSPSRTDPPGLGSVSPPGEALPGGAAVPDGGDDSRITLAGFSLQPAKWVFCALAVGVLLLGAWSWWSCVHDPAVPFLPQEQSVDWIVFPKAQDTHMHPAVPLPAVFERAFEIKEAPVQAQLSCRVFKGGHCQVNGAPVPQLALDSNRWKSVASTDIARLLKPGTNVLTLVVSNRTGPPAAWAALRGPALAIQSDSSWKCSWAGAEWQPASTASQPPRIRPGNDLFGRETLLESLRGRWLALAMLLLAAGVAATLGPRCFRVLMSANSAWGRRLGDPAVVSLVAIGLLWAALFANNLALISPLLGFDRDGHLQYVDYILQNRSLPLADQGWQMYQPPLFYTLSAIIVSPFGSTASPGAVVTLRAFSAAIGLAHVGLIFCCLRLLFPANKTRQVVGLWFASMLPAHLALSHHITNEVLSAVLVTGCLLFCLRVFRAAHPRPFALIGAGFCLGLALLTKFSAVVAVPVVAAALGWHAFAQQGGPRQAVFRALRASAIVFGVALVVCAWHYVRVWHRFGNPLIGNWDPQLPFAWWQDPGFRTSAWLWNLGPGVASPLFSGMFGFWDGIYSTLWADGMCSGSARLPFRPAWDYGLMVAGCAIAVPMTVLLAAGAVAAIRRLFVRPGPDLILMGGLLAGLGFALLYMSLRVASFAQVKAFYALPALLPLCLGAALGYDLTQRRWPALRIALRMLTIFWVLTILCSFWIRLGNPFTWSVLGIGQADENDYRAAIASFDRALALDPKDAATTAIRADALARSGQLSEAVAAADAAVNLDPASAQAELELGIVLSLASRYAEAISHMTRALELASDLPTGPQVLATALSRLERWEEVESICRQGLVLDPLNRNLHYSLAKAMASTGNWTDAETHGRYAVGIDPGWDEAHGLMGSIFAARGQTKQAVSEFAAAVRVKPDNPQLHSLLAAAYLAAAEPEKAAEQYRETLRLEPENPETLNNLAWLLATTRADKVRSGVEAVRLAQRACELTGQREPALIGTLAAAYAETGRFGEAVQAAEKARALALDTGRPELASRNDELLRLYRAGKAAREGAQ